MYSRIMLALTPGDTSVAFNGNERQFIARLDDDGNIIVYQVVTLSTNRCIEVELLDYEAWTEYNDEKDETTLYVNYEPLKEVQVS